MSATMARQEGGVQVEQSDMRLALNMAKMASGGLLCATMEEMQCLIKNPHAEVRDGRMGGAELPGHRNVTAAIERHPAMPCENQMDGFLPC